MAAPYQGSVGTAVPASCLDHWDIFWDTDGYSNTVGILIVIQLGHERYIVIVNNWDMKI